MGSAVGKETVRRLWPTLDGKQTIVITPHSTSFSQWDFTLKISPFVSISPQLDGFTPSALPVRPLSPFIVLFSPPYHNASLSPASYDFLPS